MWGRGQRGNSATCSALGWFSVTSPATHKQIVPFWCWFPGGWFCIHSRTLWVSPKIFCEAGSFSCHINPQMFFQSEELRLYFLTLEPRVPWFVSLLSCSSQFIHMQMWDACSTSCCLAHPGPLATTLLWVLPALLPISVLPTCLDECFFLNCLVIRLSYSLIFCQFWLFFVFKFVFPIFIVWRGTLYLPMPPTWAEIQVLHVLKIPMAHRLKIAALWHCHFWSN